MVLLEFERRQLIKLHVLQLFLDMLFSNQS